MTSTIDRVASAVHRSSVADCELPAPRRLASHASAWHFGRCWNFLRYVGCRASLLPWPAVRPFSALTDRLWSKVVQHGFGAVSETDRWDRVRSIVEVVRQNSDAHLQSEANCESLCADLQEYSYLVDVGRIDRLGEWRIFGSRLRATAILFDEGWTALREEFGPTTRLVMELAKHVDLAIHPRIEQGGNWRAVGFGGSVPRGRNVSGGWNEAVPQPQPLHRPTYFPVIKRARDAAPASGWFAELEQRWLQWKAATAGASADASLPPLPDETAWQIVARIETAVLRGESAPCLETIEPPMISPPDVGGFLGIQCDATSLRVRRANVGQIVTIDTNLHFKMLAKLVAFAGEYVPEAEFVSHWRRLGGQTARVNLNAISNHISKVRPQILQLGLFIKNKTGFGWKLTDEQPSRTSRRGHDRRNQRGACDG